MSSMTPKAVIPSIFAERQLLVQWTAPTRRHHQNGGFDERLMTGIG